MWAQILGLVPIQLPVNTHWEAEDDGCSTQIPAAHSRDPEAAPGSRLEPGIAPAAVGIWGVQQ